MSISKIAFGLIAAAIGIASAASSYTVTISGPVQVGQTELKPGDYKVSIEGDKAIFKNGKRTIEVPATVENGSQKYSATMLDSAGSQLQDIQIGGTSMKIVFKSGGEGSGNSR
jgi:hypothetical protein